MAAGVLSVLLPQGTRAQDAGPPAPIEDNSFLIEEAYNQERAVVQHISSLSWSRGSHSWTYSFTQEWPLGGQRHQLSYTLPVVHTGGTRIGDVAVNYRYQLAGTDGPVALAPRVSVLTPTGSAASGTGAGGVGVQVNVPVSASVTSWLVAHGNAGVTVTPSGADAAGDRATTTAVNLGASAIWRPFPTFNVMLEVTWTHAQLVAGPGSTTGLQQIFISPGVRWAHNFRSGLQIVPGLAFPIAVGPDRGENLVFAYLSFEHPFRKIVP